MLGLGKTGMRELIRADIDRWRERRLHWIVAGIFTAALGVTAVAIVGFSAAFGAQTTLAGFVELLTINAAWFFFSLFALVGLFVGFPLHEHDFSTEDELGRELIGVLCSRWLLLSVSVIAGFVVPAIVGVLFFDAFSILGLLAVSILTAVVLCAYAAGGIAVVVVARSAERVVFWLLTIYWLLVFLWESSLVPLVIGAALTGDPEGAIGTPPLVHDLLLAASPGGAHASLSNAVVSGGFGTVELVAAVALVGWLVVPPVLARRRLSAT